MNRLPKRPGSHRLATVHTFSPMARVFPKSSLSDSRSTIHKFQTLDYVPERRSKQKIRPSTLLPVLQTSGLKKTKAKTLTSIPAEYSKPTMLMTSQLRNLRELHRAKSDSGKMQANIRLMRKMLRNRQTSLQELRNHEDFLTKLNQELIKTIQDMEDSSTLKVRALLQQQDILGTISNTLEYSNKKTLQQMKCELQEWEEKQESKMSYLEQQVKWLNAKIKKTHEEVSFLSTYMDHEYPVKSVQIASLVRQLRHVKDSQQKTQKPHQMALLQKTRENENMVKNVDKFRKFINQFEEEVPILRAKVKQLQVQTQEPREIVFADVLLRKPKCTPDMDVILDIPVEELLPF
ncbi:uncharacterized protein C20orf96 homolog isoform X2 [Rousettus aegyptiacus]|uniref:Uncharacterized protein n=1 Tax=Rousettus aegyptiacus TaxID=9407 RepID=A0A7J8DFC1_ROUAE|nr:uncharacterized protein C20orf96 homolog isoform X2 [Rousettus aegyptiacus]KAF6421823.1 hypothetical protein HJG63_001819 [Rousettus aegyptiacus]